jgi:AcrR family transcriptional regulator
MSTSEPRSTVQPRNPRFDTSRDEAIQSATAALLAEVGYDAMSIEVVAARAGTGKATIYRPWPDKAALVLDTLRGRGMPQPELPDTRSLRSDLRSLLSNVRGAGQGQQSLDHLVGVLVAMRSHPELVSAVSSSMILVRLLMAEPVDTEFTAQLVD